MMTIREMIRNWLLEHPRVNPYKFSLNQAYAPLRQITSNLRVFPNFIILGASRSGTTSLYYNLNKHPNIHEGAKKASSFFDTYYDNGLDFYKSHFPIKVNSKQHENKKLTFVTGEATTTYLLNPFVPERMFDSIPNVKLIAILRNPIDRSFSHFNYHLSRGESKFDSFEDAIEYEKNLMKLGNFQKNIFENKEMNYRFCSYLSESLYIERLEPYLKKFSKEQIMIIKYEDYIEREQEVLQNIFSFLSVAPYQVSNPSKLNAVNYDNMNQSTRKYLHEFFKPYNEKLSQVFGSNFNWS
jgi:hypothetical protein